MKKLIFILTVCMLVSRCDQESPSGPSNMPSNGYVEVTCPKGGETFTVGSTVTLAFKVNADKVTGVIPQVSLDNGATWSDIVSQQVSPTGTGGQLLSYDWKIGQEVIPVVYADNNAECKIKVYDYNDKTKYHMSEKFTVNQ